MKIVHVSVEELITGGVYLKPQLTIELDLKVGESLPDPTPVQQADEEERVRVEGVKYSFLADLKVLGTDLDRPLWLNNYFPGKPWVHVRVNGFQPVAQWYIPLDRARKEMHKHITDWELVVDDTHAQAGQLVWRLRQKELICKARDTSGNPRRVFCEAPAVHEIRRGNYYIPLCRVHLDLFTAEAARKRIR